jgi:putative endonuclease
MQNAEWFERLKRLFRRSRPPPEAGDSKAFGAWGEGVAAEFLRGKGFKILARNFTAKGVKGDLDLIAWEGQTLVFVEVKTRSAGAVRSAESAVDWRKRRTLIRLARVYRRKQRLQRSRWRYDVVSVYPGPRIEHFPNAFSEG